MLTTDGKCDKHRKEVRRLSDAERGSAHERGYTARWQRASKRFLAEHPLCQCPDCDEGRKRVTASTVVDHKVPHRGNRELFWDESNWQALAKPCHDRKTALEDGGFGHARVPAPPSAGGGSLPGIG